MKLFYYKAPEGNIGDDINKFVFNELAPGFFDEDENELFIGVGSILNHKIPAAKKINVFSSGIGYGALPKMDENWNFISVRGELTKKALCLEPEVPMIDGAYFIHEIFKPKITTEKYKCSFIPHVDSAANGDWKCITELLGIHYIDPRIETLKGITEIANSTLIIAEAMHGAILADIYGVPWIPVKAYSYIDTNKWRDWLSPFNMDIKFNDLLPVYKGDIDLAGTAKFRTKLKRTIQDIPKIGKNITRVPPARSNNMIYESNAELLVNIIRDNRSYLTDEKNVIEAKDRSFSALQTFISKREI